MENIETWIIEEIRKATDRRGTGTNRSPKVAYLNGYINAMRDVLDRIQEPQRAKEIQDAINNMIRR